MGIWMLNSQNDIKKCVLSMSVHWLSLKPLNFHLMYTQQSSSLASAK